MMEEEEGARQQQQQCEDFVQPTDTHGDAAYMAINPQATNTRNTQLLASPHDQVRHTIEAPCSCYVAYCPPLLLFAVVPANNSNVSTQMSVLRCSLCPSFLLPVEHLVIALLGHTE